MPAAEQELTVRVHSEDDGYWAEVVELPGCFASGETLDDLLDGLREAISLYMTDDADGIEIGSVKVVDRPVQVDEMKVLV